MKATYEFSQGQKVSSVDPETGEPVTGIVEYTTGYSVFIRWADTDVAHEYFREDFGNLKLVK